MRRPLALSILILVSLFWSACQTRSPEPARQSAEKSPQSASVARLPEDLGAYRFFTAPRPDPREDNQMCAYGLWKGQPLPWSAVRSMAGKDLLVGVERDAIAEDNAVTDFSFTDPKGLILQDPVLKRTFSTKTSVLYQFGVLYPSTQADVVWDGLVRWIWSEGVRLDPVAGSDEVSFGSHAARPQAFVQPLISPILRGSEEEIQAVVQDHKAAKVRKLFLLRGQALREDQIGLRAMNDRKEDQFPSRFTEVTPAERARPDIAIRVARLAKVKKEVGFTLAQPIRSSFLRCTTRHNAPGFLNVDVNLEGWSGASVKLSAEVQATSQAPSGDHYFRVIDRVSWDHGRLYKERVAKVTVE